MKKFTIFVLDDDKMFCDLLLVLAKRDLFVHDVGGYKLDLVIFSDMQDLDGAVEYIKDNKPDLVLLDYFLGPNGCAASLGILEKIVLCCGGRIDIVLITGVYSEDIRLVLAKEVLTTMNVRVVQKPFSISELLEVIKVSIRKKESDKYS